MEKKQNTREKNQHAQRKTPPPMWIMAVLLGVYMIVKGIYGLLTTGQ